MKQRRDRGQLAAPITATDGQSGIYEGVVATVHTDADPLVYKWGKEFRRADVLPLISAQLPGKPVTMLHPREHYNHGGKVKPVGVIASARVDGDHVVATIVITDEKTLTTIAGGVRDLSLGYDARCDDGGYQVAVDVDHLALVPVGRCTSCELRADASVACPTCGTMLCEECGMSEGDCSCSAAVPDGAVNAVATITTEPHADCACKHVDVSSMSDSVISSDAMALGTVLATKLDTANNMPYTNGMDEIQQLQAKLDEALALVTKTASELNDVKLRADEADAAKLAAEILAQNASKDLEQAVANVEAVKVEIEKVRKDAADSIPGLVKARTALESTANTVIGAADRSAMTDKEIKVAVIKHVDGDDLDDTKPDLYIDGIFDGAVKRHRKGATALAETRQVLEVVRNDAAAEVVAAAEVLNSEKAADAAIRQRYSNAWMTPSTKKDN